MKRLPIVFTIGKKAMKLFIGMLVLSACALILATGSGYAAEVNGIYTEAATKDAGDVLGIAALKGLKVRGWFDAFYDLNLNFPDRATVANPENQKASVVKTRHATVEGRTFDVHANSVGLSLAEIELEKVPDRGGVGFKFDLAFGDTQDIIVDTIAVASGPDAVSFFEKSVQHASVSYLAPIGKGLRVDLGRFVTHIGGETIETIKNNNYSHGFFYTYAIPFQDSGVRLNYPLSDKLYIELYLLNGWNITADNNEGKSIGPSIGFTPSPKLSLYVNYLGGPEQLDNTENLRHLIDAQLFLSPIDKLNILANFDFGFEQKVIEGKEDASWLDFTGIVRYKVSDRLEPALRGEFYSDPDGWTTGVAQDLIGLTLTLNYKLGNGKFANLLVRPEFRIDISSPKNDEEHFFTDGEDFRSKDNQATVGLGAVYYF